MVQPVHVAVQMATVVMTVKVSVLQGAQHKLLSGTDPHEVFPLSCIIKGMLDVMAAV